jgi:hypothetical protein
VDGYLALVTALLNRGIKVLAAAEPRATVTGPNAAQQELATNKTANLPAAAIAATTNPSPVIQVCDLSQINVGGTYPFGANYEGTSGYPGPNFVDVVHLTHVGKVNILSGANTPGLGYAAAIKALLNS